MKIGYFPGCSLHSTGREFNESLRLFAPAIGLELEEIKDWNCCGATSAHATNHLLSIALPARSLALAEEQGMSEVLAPCAACYSRLRTASVELRENPSLQKEVSEVLERPIAATAEVRSISEVLSRMTADIRGAVVQPLAGLKLACYYGCLLVRPPKIASFEDSEMPTSLEGIVSACGAEAVHWDRKLDCCGGGMSLSRTGSVIRLGRSIVSDAQKAGAHAIVVACPMCHSNLDFRQRAMLKGQEGEVVPVLYITQIVGLALGLEPEKLGLRRHFVKTAPFIQRITTVPATAQEA
ncbi:MAG: CoB--CoM heterodisulfide reductase iron-sulfur subunit B family protein [Myxococcota bacterium]|jgi:heterodisulfide reductase subunit B|nr:CoB--CoM heterodisulfide reductase iron-sulfur subunit B family protein [Myxococcota bacterium]